MSSISATSSLADVEAAYDNNASYAEDNDPAKAKAFLTACRMLLRRYPRIIGSGQQHTQLNTDLIQSEIDTAQRWLEANDTATPRAGGPRVTRASFENFREF